MAVFTNGACRIYTPTSGRPLSLKFGQGGERGGDDRYRVRWTPRSCVEAMPEWPCFDDWEEGRSDKSSASSSTDLELQCAVPSEQPCGVSAGNVSALKGCKKLIPLLNLGKYGGI